MTNSLMYLKEGGEDIPHDDTIGLDVVDSEAIHSQVLR